MVPLRGRPRPASQSQLLFHQEGVNGRGQGFPVQGGEPDRGVQTGGQEFVLVWQLVPGNEHPLLLDYPDVMVPGHVLEVPHGKIGLGVEFLFMVELRGLMGGRAAAGGNTGGNDVPPEVAALELVGASEEHPQHRLSNGFHALVPLYD